MHILSRWLFWVLLSLLLFFYFLFEEYQLVSNKEIHSWTKNQSADCAVVLTGGSGRIQEGIALLNQKRIKKLIISGVNPISSLQEIFPPLPFYGNLDIKDIVLEKKSKTTFGNAQQSAAVLEALNCQSVLLITSRLHMHRATRTFRANLSEHINLEPRAIYGGRREDAFQYVGIEVIKSFFYRWWAY